MKIGMVLLTRFPPDIRVEKEVATLEKEHEVFMLCSRRAGQQVDDVWHGLKVRRVFSKFERWWNNWRLMATCHSNGWENEIRAYVKDFRIDALHVHDLPLLGAAVKVAREFNIPVIADLHENYPQMLAQDKMIPLYKRLRPTQLMLALSVSIEQWTKYEMKAVSMADKIITVIEESRDRLLNNGLPSEKLHIVANYVDNADLDEHKKDLPGKFRVIYTGGFSSSRDLRTVIDAVAKLSKDELPNLEVVMVGGKGAELVSLREMVRRNAIEDRVIIHEWLPLKEAKEFIDTSAVGLVPHMKTPHTDSTIPHKIFQYMAKKLPVIVSDCAPLERIVSEAQCGLVYKSGDSDSFTRCLKKIYSDAVAREAMGNAGYLAVKNKYNWNVAGEELLNIYRQR